MDSDCQDCNLSLVLDQATFLLFISNRLITKHGFFPDNAPIDDVACLVFSDFLNHDAIRLEQAHPEVFVLLSRTIYFSNGPAYKIGLLFELNLRRWFSLLRCQLINSREIGLSFAVRGQAYVKHLFVNIISHLIVDRQLK